ncbi:MAG: hypothetical protein AAB355_00295 [Patescibacteria group bacterium]
MADEKKEKTDEKPKEDFELVKEAMEKLKFENDAYDAQKARAEKIRAEKLIGGRGMMAPPAEGESPAEKMAGEMVKAFRR